MIMPHTRATEEAWEISFWVFAQRSPGDFHKQCELFSLSLFGSQNLNKVHTVEDTRHFGQRVSRIQTRSDWLWASSLGSSLYSNRWCCASSQVRRAINSPTQPCCLRILTMTGIFLNTAIVAFKSWGEGTTGLKAWPIGDKSYPVL